MKRVFFVFLWVIFLLTAISPTAKAVPLSWTDPNIHIGVDCPRTAYVGDTIEVNVRVEARKYLKDVTILITCYGSKDNGINQYFPYLFKILVLSKTDLSAGLVRQESFKVKIPSDADPGLGYGNLFIEYTTTSLYQREEYWNMIYLKNKAYEDLQSSYYDLLNEHQSLQTTYNNYKATHIHSNSEYDSLRSEYNSYKASYDKLKVDYDSLKTGYDKLRSDYDSLETDYNDLRSKYDDLRSKYEGVIAPTPSEFIYLLPPGLIYVFIATTLIFMVTTIYFARKKPKI